MGLFRQLRNEFTEVCNHAYKMLQILLRFGKGMSLIASTLPGSGEISFFVFQEY